jgi:hypothetical protein
MSKAYSFSEIVKCLKSHTAFYLPTTYNFAHPPWDWDNGEPSPTSWSIALSGISSKEKEKWKPCTVNIYPVGYKSRGDVPPGAELVELLDSTTLIEQDGSYYLALTASGRDMRWEICHSYIRLGFLPPAHFASKLAAGAGRGLDEQDKLILAGCRRSLVVVRDARQSDLQSFLDRFSAELEGVVAVVD